MSQIRIANKQDESHIRALLKDALKSISKELDLEGSDADLKNIEWSYFGHDGVFVVLEVSGNIEGLAGAYQLSDDALLIKRLYVKPERYGEGLDELLEMLIDFARKMDYRLVESAETAIDLVPKGYFQGKQFKNEGGRLVVSCR